MILKYKCLKAIRYGLINIGNLFFSNKYLIMAFFLPFFKTDGFIAIPYLPLLANIMIVLECLIFLAMVNVLRIGSLFLKFILLMGLWGYIIGPTITGSSMPSFFYISGALGLVCFFELGFYYNVRKFLEATSDLFAIMIVLNFISALQKNGIAQVYDGTPIYLFGLRTGFTLVVIPGIMMCLFFDWFLNKKIFSMKSIIAICFGAGSIFLSWVATGIIELVIISILWIYAGGIKRKRPLNIVFIFFAIMSIDFMITIIGIQNSIISLVTDWLGKDATFSGRTYIWSRVLIALSERPLFGYGLDSTVSIYGTLKPAHNQWLHTAMENGYVGLAILIIGILFSCIQLNKYQNTRIYQLLTTFCTATLVGCISEIQIYVPFFYSIFELPYLIGLADKEKHRMQGIIDNNNQKEKTMSPQFSVIVPFYNAEKHIKKCIDSLLNQNEPIYELILVNDGSTDGSMEICKKYEPDDRVVLINKANGGVSSARNTGLHAAHGEYIIFVDSDDFVKETLCEEYSNILSMFDCDMIVSGVQFQDSKQGYRRVPSLGITSGLYQKEDTDLLFSKLYRGSIFNAPWSKCYKRILILELFDTRYNLGEDLLFNLNYLLHCSNIYFLDKPLYVYDISGISSLSSKYLQDGFAILKSVYIESVALIDNVWNGKVDHEAVKEKFIVDNCVMAERLVQQKYMTVQNRVKIINEELTCILNNNSFDSVKLNYGLKWNIYYYLLKKGHYWIFTYFVIGIKAIQKRKF